METIVTEVIRQILTLAASVLASGVVTTALTQVLKLEFIKIPAQRYPVHTAAVLSLLVSAGAVFYLQVVPLVNTLSYIVFSGVTLLVATQSYNVVKKAIEDYRQNH